MNAVRHVRIFRNGRSRAVRIPKDLDIFDDDLVMREEDGRIILERPTKKRDLREAIDWLRAQPRLSDDEQFQEIDDPLPDKVEL